MTALELLLKLRSHGKLAAPAPHGKSLDNLLLAAVNVPDHGRLRPWRFLIAEGEGLDRFGEILAAAETRRGGDDAQVARARSLPRRAPMIITVIASPKPHDKVPAWEQVASAICAAQAIQMCAYAQGFGAIWRSGYFAEDRGVAEALGVAERESLVGFIYIGTPSDEAPPAPVPDLPSLVARL